jgi:hypothetical protein
MFLSKKKKKLKLTKFDFEIKSFVYEGYHYKFDKSFLVSATIDENSGWTDVYNDLFNTIEYGENLQYAMQNFYEDIIDTYEFVNENTKLSPATKKLKTFFDEHLTITKA